MLIENIRSVVQATDEYKTDIDPTSLWIETRYTGNQADSVPSRLLFDDFMKFARENELQLPPTSDERRWFGNTVMKKYKSKARRIEGSVAKHYFCFRLPN